MRCHQELYQILFKQKASVSIYHFPHLKVAISPQKNTQYVKYQLLAKLNNPNSERDPTFHVGCLYFFIIGIKLNSSKSSNIEKPTTKGVKLHFKW